MLETLDWRMVTASPMEGFLFEAAEALKALAEVLSKFCWAGTLEMSLDNISKLL
jgi:hypothetical protein